MSVKAEELDKLRCEITTIPTKHFNHAARAIHLAENLLKERDAIIVFAKQLLLETGLSEKEALAQIFRRLHGGPDNHRNVPSPFESIR